MDTENIEKMEIANQFTASSNRHFDQSELDRVLESAIADGTALNVRGQLLDFLQDKGWRSTDLLSSTGSSLHKDSVAGKAADIRYQALKNVALKGHIVADVQIDADGENLKGAKRTEYIESEVSTWLSRVETLDNGGAIGANHKLMIAGWKTNAKDSVTAIRNSLKKKEDIASGKTKATTDINDRVGNFLDRLESRMEKFDDAYKTDIVMTWVKQGRVIIQEDYLFDSVSDDDQESSEQ